jgi:hypothetical protein
MVIESHVLEGDGGLKGKRWGRFREKCRKEKRGKWGEEGEEILERKMGCEWEILGRERKGRENREKLEGRGGGD